MSLTKPFQYLFSILSCAIMAFSTGCASGGYKITRSYAKWLNSQMIVLRIVLYIVTLPVWLVTTLIDVVIFNTMDFWNGTVSAGNYKFKKDDQNYLVKHEYQPGTTLKKSTIEIRDLKSKLLQTVVIQEKLAGQGNVEIELWVDGALRTTVQDLAQFPIATIFDPQGAVVKQEAPLMKYGPITMEAYAQR